MNGVLHTKIDSDDAEILKSLCDNNNVSVSALLNALIDEFLECKDLIVIDRIIQKARRIKQGRPRG